MNSLRNFRGPYSAAVVLAALLGSPARGQIEYDGSLGPSGVPAGAPDFEIPHTDGTLAGPNLYHSFATFNINAGESATFSGPASIANVLSRVTGGDVSFVGGLLRSTIPGADFYLINPSGVMFGEDASLDVPGAFHASSADYLLMGDGGRFGAANAGGGTLSVAPPAAFGFLGPPAGAIEAQGAELSVAPDQTLSLVGGGVRLTAAGGQRTRLHAFGPSGRVNLAAVASAGEAALLPSGMDTGDFASLGDIRLNDSTVDASGATAGAIVIRGGTVVLEGATDGSNIVADSTGDGTGAPISVQADELSIRDGSLIRSRTFGAGRSSDIEVEAHSVHLVDGAAILSGTVDGGQNVGAVRVAAENFENDGGLLAVFHDGGGDGGKLQLNSTRVAVTNDGIVASVTVGAGDGGPLTLEASELFISDGAQVAAQSDSQSPLSVNLGDAGDVRVAAGRVTIDAASLNAVTFGDGRGGNISLSASEVVLLAGGVITAGTSGAGDGGRVEVVADSILIDGVGPLSQSGIGSRAEIGSSGAGGSVSVAARELVLSAGGGISTDTFGTGAGGSVTVAGERILLTGSGAFDPSGIASRANPGASGAGGSIVISGGQLTLSDGAGVSTSTAGAGNGGRILVAAGALDLDGGSAISAGSAGTGRAGNIRLALRNSLRGSDAELSTEAALADGGDIFIKAGDLVLLRDSTVSTSVQGGAGAGGNIDIDPPLVILLNSAVIANAVGGPGGNISITASFFLTSPGTLIQASSALGIDGTVALDAPDSDVSGSIAELPAEFFDASSLLRSRCSASVDAGANSLVVAGDRESGPGPDDYLLAPSAYAEVPAGHSRRAGPYVMACAYGSSG